MYATSIEGALVAARRGSSKAATRTVAARRRSYSVSTIRDSRISTSLGGTTRYVFGFPA